MYQSFEGSLYLYKEINGGPMHFDVLWWSYIVHPFHPFPQLLAAQTFTFKWWMGHYNASSPKPQRGWCNNKAFANLDKGPYRRSVQPKAKVQTVRKTISKTGKLSYAGTAALKESESCPHFSNQLCIWFLQH
jgi:uncharacterized protein YwbE